MELTRFDLKNQAIQERTASALERLVGLLEKIQGRNADDQIVRAYTHGFNTARGIEGDTDVREVKKIFDRELQKCLKTATTKNRS